MSIEVMINECYGGFSVSNSAINEYRKRCPEKEAVCNYDVDRDDAVMIQIFKEMGERANGKHAQIKLQQIPARYARHYSIGEYDGLEHVVIHYNAYKIHAAKEILSDKNLTKSEKLTRISTVLNADLVHEN